MNIEDLAKEIGLTPRTIRYCVQKGLIKRPARRGHRRGFYDSDDEKKLQKIKQLRDSGLSFTKIREELKSQIPQAWNRYELMPDAELNLKGELARKVSKEEIIIFRTYFLERFSNKKPEK